MKRELLRQLIAAQREERPAVLVRGLSNGVQLLVEQAATYGDTRDLPGELLQEARQALRRDGAVTRDIAGERYLLQTLCAPPRLIIVGAVHIAQALIPMARAAGHRIRLIDPRTAFATAERFPDTEISSDWPQEVLPGMSLDARTAVVTLSHDAKIDEPALQAALASAAYYIGALGSRKNHAKRLERLAASGFGEQDLARIAGPIGLPLGGRSPAEIAVAILAQIIQARYRPQLRA